MLDFSHLQAAFGAIDPRSERYIRTDIAEANVLTERGSCWRARRALDRAWQRYIKTAKIVPGSPDPILLELARARVALDRRCW